ncbi:glycosyltransferase family 2 protein [Exiguobacterium sp. Helios]|uniref:glycosyltransferase family 2 protein n=1 Tax=unclassified Exiguobacterium TaxID=2644629 RepID=UPI00103F507C|nr:MULTISPECIES: glycosyltransferase family 2 protein [unclassified Exiguobacterium]QNR21865.1 glycosyltransferase family 2 protein [Exiguobacterium sp. Helios]
MPMVSVIIPTYNRLRELREALTALTKQIYQDFEVIILNNNGEPLTPVLTDFQDKLTITSIDLPENHHVRARNHGVSLATGKYILLHDDDDLLLPSHIEEVVGDLEAGADLTYVDAELFTYEWQQDRRVVKTTEPFAYPYDREAMKEDSTYIPSGSLYRKSLHEKLGLFDEDVFNYWDWDWILRVGQDHLVLHPARATVLYAFNPAGNHQSAKQDASRRVYFDRLVEKHHLPTTDMKNFHIVQEERRSRLRETRRTFHGNLTESE